VLATLIGSGIRGKEKPQQGKEKTGEKGERRRRGQEGG